MAARRQPIARGWLRHERARRAGRGGDPGRGARSGGARTRVASRRSRLPWTRWRMGPALVIGVSHEGATWATMRALEVARRRWRDDGADHRLSTGTGGCPRRHRPEDRRARPVLVPYGRLPVADPRRGSRSRADAAVDAPGSGGGAIRPRRGTCRGRRHRRPSARGRSSPAAIGSSSSGAAPTGIAARELTLKIEEGTHIPAAFRDLETLLHGHLAGMDERTGLVADRSPIPRDAPARRARLRQVLRARSPIGYAGVGRSCVRVRQLDRPRR